MMSGSEIKVEFRPKSRYQKDDCIFPGCEMQSTLEAVTSLSAIRCCKKRQHMVYAAELAEVPHKVITAEKRTVPAKNFLETVAVNLDNPKLTDAEFRKFIRNTLPIVIY